MPFLKKAHAGGDSFGHVWAHDGDVVEVTDAELAALLAIPDGDFTVVDGPAPEPDPAPEPTPDPQPDVPAARRTTRKPKPETAE